MISIFLIIFAIAIIAIFIVAWKIPINQVAKSVLVSFIILGIVFILGITFLTSDIYIDIITKMAANADNSSMCKLIIPPFMSSDDPIGACYTSVAVRNKDIKKCVIVGWTCFRIYFESHKPADNKVCDVLEGTGYLVQCYQELQRVLNR